MTYLANHLWQSTLFGVLVALAAAALRNSPAKTRHWLWLAASIKFLIPFSLLLSLGTRVEVPPVPWQMPALTVEQITTSFAPAPMAPPAHPQASTPWWPIEIAVVWLAGVLLLLSQWFVRWRRLRSALRTASPFHVAASIRVVATRTMIEPGIFGIFRPVMLLPEGIMSTLTAEELDAILAHEFAHVRRRDNLWSALHMLIQALFWFHPLLWWIGRKLVEERERACDEAVLGEGKRRQIYAQGILSVCRFYLASPLPCASGVGGAGLMQRIKEIMTRRIPPPLTFAGKLTLSFAVIAVLSVPLIIGVLRAQTLPPPPAYTYEVVSIHPTPPGENNSSMGPGAQGGMRTHNTPVIQLLTFAYDVREYQFQGAPGWVRSDRFDVNFTPEKTEITPAPDMPRSQMEGWFNRQRQRMQAVLRDRFGLVLRAETREMPIFALTIGKNGHKLSPPQGKGGSMTTNWGKITANGAYLKMLTETLSGLLGRPVINQTGLDGPYDFKMEWTPDSAVMSKAEGDGSAGADSGNGASIFAAIQEQLGLKLESKRGPAPVFVIEKISRPTEN